MEDRPGSTCRPQEGWTGQQGWEGLPAGTGKDTHLPRGSGEALRGRQCGAGHPRGWLHVDREGGDISQRTLDATVDGSTNQT